MPTSQTQGRQPRMTKAQRRAQLAAAAKEAARKRQQRRQILLASGITAGILAVGGVIAIIVATTSGSGPSNPQTAPTGAAASGTVPSWPAPDVVGEVRREQERAPDRDVTVIDAGSRVARQRAKGRVELLGCPNVAGGLVQCPAARRGMTAIVTNGSTAAPSRRTEPETPAGRGP